MNKTWIQSKTICVDRIILCFRMCTYYLHFLNVFTFFVFTKYKNVVNNISKYIQPRQENLCIITNNIYFFNCKKIKVMSAVDCG